ncbi:hypothetical protein BU26DRAFT_65314 [Trematosphaeria pertusa]|uniref:Uncharacterized protein n=1 Tax=Trematosphaeria pertusa TaxID=390896 RepID=A0A6A6I9R7_9PLEO|nr:uncharacterized protein BU26DRAFT_65314 [Trematosphaeria pertusa]KAF2246273.1 hypothetical protein BU26DRAFT_65314 [Trematosphaeria pertusa]
MLPGAGLYLPGSLYSKQDPTSDRADKSARWKFFERKPSKQEQDSFDRTSGPLSGTSSDDITKIFSSLSTVFDFAEFASQQGKVSSETEVFINLIQRVRQDVTEASRLYVSPAVIDHLEAWPDKKAWVDMILVDIERSLNDIGVYMETVRVTGDDGGTVGLRRKFEWVLSHHKKLINKQQYLTLCHSSLMAAVQAMQTAEMNGAYGPHDPIYEAPSRPWIQDEGRDILRSPHSRQKWRLSQKNLSLPSITVSEVHRDKIDAGSINSLPIELPGSTPDDLPDPDNLDLYAPPPKPRAASLDAILSPSSDKEALDTSSGLETDKSPVYAPSRPPMEVFPARRSLDQVRTSESTLYDMRRASLDHVRPRAYSDQVRPQRSFEMKPRASFDQVRRMPTLNEKPLERYDSTASVSVDQAATIPLSAMRYRPKAVQVRKPTPKHRSLPSLPSLPSQSSLINDLSPWILPSEARDSIQSYQSADTNISLNASTPATSVASSPVLPSPSSCPAMLGGADSGATTPVPSIRPPPASASPTVDVPSSPKDETPLLPPRRYSQIRRPGTSRSAVSALPSCNEEGAETSAPENPSKLLRRLLSNASSTETNATQDEPSGSRVVASGTPEKLLVKADSDSSARETACDEEHEEQPPPLPPRPAARAPGSSSPPIPTEVPASTLPIVAAEPDKSKEANVPRSTGQAPLPSPSEQSQEPATESATLPHSMAYKMEVIDTIPPPQPPQPTTAQARRRAAHARRMQIAYGGG